MIRGLFESTRLITMDTLNYYSAYAKANFALGAANSATLTKVNFVEILYDRLGLSRTEASAVVESIFDEIEQALLNGRDVKLANFGTFSTRDKVARPGRNPKTGQQHVISARRVVTFVPAPHLRDSLAGVQEPEEVAAQAA